MSPGILRNWVAAKVAGAGRAAVAGSYRMRGHLTRYKASIPGSVQHPQSEAQPGHAGARLATNPFIASELGRLNLQAAPIPTLLRETYGQCNEDIIVESLLRARLTSAGRSFSSMRYLEIGGNHPVQTSSTYLFYRAWGAQGWLVEADPKLAQRLRVTRPRDTIIDYAISDLEAPTLTFYIHERNELSSLSRENIASFSHWGGTEKIVQELVVPNLHVNALFDRYVDVPLDFMSIDIEGLDVAVLRAMRSDVRPSVIQAEWRGIKILLDEFVGILSPRGYALAGLTDVNAIFVAI